MQVQTPLRLFRLSLPSPLAYSFSQYVVAFIHASRDEAL